ncbi:MAG: DHH family phosphoesterase, partial [Syntrophales bacterium]
MLEGRLPTTRWHLREGNENTQNLFINELGLSPIVSRILMSRDIVNIDIARRFLSPSLRDLHNPFLMQDMKKAADRLIRAIYQQEKIVIYGDYDADGITSVVVLLHFIRQIYKNVTHYIPDRIAEGYGLHREAVERLRSEERMGLIVTVDCGISDHEPISY